MNFLQAIKHAAIDYGIRRKAWRDDAILSLDNAGQLRWVADGKIKGRSAGRMVTGDDTCDLLGVDHGYDLQPEDIRANDWETV